MAKLSQRKGRPVGTTGPTQPKEAVQNWKPQHEQILMLHLTGQYSNIEIAQIVNMTPERVGQILNDPKSKEIIELWRLEGRKNLMTSIKDRVLVLAEKSLKNLEKTVNADISPLHKAKPHQDKIGMEFLSMIGYGKQAQTSGDPQNGSNGSARSSLLSEDTANRLASALEKSNKVREINPIEEAIVIDVEVVEEPAA